MIYTIIETAKSNNLKPYEYFEYLLTKVTEINMEEEKEIDKIMPWLECCQKCTKQRNRRDTMFFVVKQTQ